MLDQFIIFTTSGIVLWQYNQIKQNLNPVNELIRTILLEQRGGEKGYNWEQFSMKWSFANELQLIFVAVYQKFLILTYIDELLQAIKKKFSDLHSGHVKEYYKYNFDDFSPIFQQILEKLETQARASAQKGPRSFSETERGKKIEKSGGATKKPSKKKKKPSKGSAGPEAGGLDEEEEGEEEQQEDEQQEEQEEQEETTTENGEATQEQSSSSQNNVLDDSSELSEEQRLANLQRLTLRKSAPVKKVKTPATTTNPKATPKRRTWDDSITKEEMKALDRSKPLQQDSKPAEPVQVETPTFDLNKWNIEEEEEKPEAPKSGFFSYLQGLAGNKALEASDLAAVLDKFKNHLIQKNVASIIAEKLCESVSASLVGKKLSTLQVKSNVRDSLEQALVRILTPKRDIDPLREALQAKEKGELYVIAFCGVNGVGKSTNLAKICSYFQQNNLKVLLAACDTFRAGAVEQLATHARRLNVELFERGYRTDPTLIAKDAISYAKSVGKDIVLIDTAGRMQENIPLMQALCKLVNTIRPNLLLFVGEALVGNDGADQLASFNKALADLSREKSPRLIDGIVLTKFDTIDDKVGAAISMVYSTGQPIVFLGTGQHYSDLKKMNVEFVTKALLRGA